MIDHAPRIRAQQQAQIENEIIADLEKRAAPMQWALMLAVLAVMLAAIVEQSSDFYRHYTDLAHTNEAMVQCLNGQTIVLDNGFLRCEVRENKLVAGILPEEVQP